LHARSASDSEQLEDRYVFDLIQATGGPGTVPIMKKALVVLAMCLAPSVPQLGDAASASRQEYQDALHSKPNLDRGADLFRTCLVCHGPSGAGVPDGSVPRIAGQHFSVILAQLVDYRHDKRWDPRMEHFADSHHLTNAQALADVAAYVSQLQTQPEDRLGVGSGDLASHGAQIYASACASCHGPDAEGSARQQIPQLAGQHFEYLRRQIYDAVDGRRPNFSREHIGLLARLEHDDIVAVCDFLSRTPRSVVPLPSLAAAAYSRIPKPQ
jgi:cytochrome c553